MKLSLGMSLGIPSGGAIILGNEDGIPLEVGLGEELDAVSWMMLEPMTKLVALSLPVGLAE
jgi:hypothetical protein